MSRIALILIGMVALAILSFPATMIAQPPYNNHQGTAYPMWASPAMVMNAGSVRVAQRHGRPYQRAIGDSSDADKQRTASAPAAVPDPASSPAPAAKSRQDEAPSPKARSGGPVRFASAVAPEADSSVAIPGPLGKLLSTSLHDQDLSDRRYSAPVAIGASAGPLGQAISSNNMQTRLAPSETDKIAAPVTAGPDARFRNVEIEVSHSEHVLKVLGVTDVGGKTILKECKVGLGAREFPTPVGVYFVTHIYDEDPWWIPPTNRAWAWGQSPSRRVYGGTMAPLLKKRMASSRKKAAPEPEDYISDPVSLEDYGYRFHGTNAPRSIGRNESHGCVRMLPKDAKEVADLIKEHVGVSEQKESENGAFVVLKAPVRLNLVK